MSSRIVKDDISFNFKTQEWEGITVEQIKKWEEAYPDCDVVDILLKKMPIWFDSNPEKAHKTRWKKFITNWLSRQQDGYDKFKKFHK